MASMADLEAAYQKYTADLTHWLPDGLQEVDLALLQRLDVLGSLEDGVSPEGDITQYFHVVESPEKITLFNDRFVVWIVPELVEGKPVTYCLIGLNHPDSTKLEIGFAASGVYNTSKMVLRILEHFLKDIRDTEDLLTEIG